MGKRNRRRQGRSIKESSPNKSTGSTVARADNQEPTSSSEADATLLFDVGTRVEILDLTQREGYKNLCTANCGTNRGIICHHWVEYDGVAYSYMIRAECGKYILIMHTDKFIKERDMTLRFKVGERVECRMDESEWLPGTITGTWCSLSEEEEGWREWPYKIYLDDKSTTYAPDDDDDVIRKSELPYIQIQLRFKVGDRVDCHMGGSWKTGSIYKTWETEEGVDYSEPPYRIILDEGGKTTAPYDEDNVIKKSDVPPPTCFICLDNDQSETNLIVRECACRGDSDNGYIHVQCLLELAKSKLKSMTMDGFMSCITCKQAFKEGGICEAALKSKFETIYGEYHLDVGMHREAQLWKCRSLIAEQEYDCAKEILHEGISKFSSKIQEFPTMQIENSTPIDHETFHALHQRQDPMYHYHFLIKFLYELSQVHLHTSSWDEIMIAVLKKIMKLIEAIGIRSGLFTVYYYVKAKEGFANAAGLNGNTERAEKTLEEALSVARERSDFDPVYYSELLYSCGYAKLRYSNWQTGLEQMAEAVKSQEAILGYHDCDVREKRERLDQARLGIVQSRWGFKISCGSGNIMA